MYVVTYASMYVCIIISSNVHVYYNYARSPYYAELNLFPPQTSYQSPEIQLWVKFGGRKFCG